MDYVGSFLGGLAIVGIVSDRLLSKYQKAARKFPWCHTCGTNMTTVGLPKFMPGEVLNYLDKYGLPVDVVIRFICPKGHYQLWFVPRLGNTEKPFFLKEEL
jgi:hypothetical protein